MHSKHQDLSKFEERIGVEFRDKSILRQALTHRSYINESSEQDLGHYERFEFLGDAVLELAVTKYLFHSYKDKDEGLLTAIRSASVNADVCSKVALEIGLGDYILLSRGESREIGKSRNYILANCLEALLGAIYLDRGFETAEHFILGHFGAVITDIVEQELWIDSKSRFQELAQEKFEITPSYRTLHESGPGHERIFTAGAYIGDKKVSEGSGRSKQEAEQAAAHEAVSKIQLTDTRRP